jgi:hypothetical protein
MRSSARPLLLAVACAAALSGTVLSGTVVFGAAPSTGAGAFAGAAIDSGRVEARWVWPTGSRVVGRAWEAPSSDYAAGHRGLDVPAALGSTASAVDDGTVAFAGAVGGRTVVTIDHGDGLVSTLDSVTPPWSPPGTKSRRAMLSGGSRSGTVRHRHRASTWVHESTVTTSTRWRTCHRLSGRCSCPSQPGPGEPTGNRSGGTSAQRQARGCAVR